MGLRWSFCGGKLFINQQHSAIQKRWRFSDAFHWSQRHCKHVPASVWSCLTSDSLLASGNKWLLISDWHFGQKSLVDLYLKLQSIKPANRSLSGFSFRILFQLDIDFNWVNWQWFKSPIQTQPQIGTPNSCLTKITYQNRNQPEASWRWINIVHSASLLKTLWALSK